jgi:HEAT repeat protein
MILLLLALQAGPEALVERLRSDRIEEREEAAQRLKEAGPAALSALEKAARDPDDEVSGRARYLLRAIGVRRYLTPNLRRAVPGIEERLSHGESPPWIETFLELSARPDLAADDLRALSEPAFAAARDPGQKLGVIQAARSAGLRSASPAVAGFLADGDPAVRSAALRALGALRASETLPRVLPLLGSPAVNDRHDAVAALGEMGDPQAVTPLARVLADESPLLRARAAASLARLRAREEIPAIARLLSDRDPQVRKHAARALGELQARDRIPDLAALLRDPEWPAKTAAATALGELRAVEAVPDLVLLLGDPDRYVRETAVAALRILDARAVAAGLAPLLRHPEARARTEALSLLRDLGVPEATPEALRLLEDPEPGIRALAAQALGELGTDPDRLVPLLDDRQRAPRLEAARALCRLGSGRGVPALLADPEEANLFALNLLRSPDRCARLRRQEVTLPASGRRAEVIDHLAREAGLAPDYGRLGEETDLKTDLVWLGQARRQTVLAALQAAVGAGPAEAVIETDRLRILPRAEGLAFWKTWWAGQEKGRLVASAEPGWPQWRGPRRDGVSDEKGLLSSWPAGGPRALWSAAGIGSGYSAPIVARGSLFITGDAGAELQLSAFDLAGKLKWRAKNGKSWQGDHPGARASPVFDDGRLYHLNAHGRAACLDAETGRELWAVETLERFESRNIEWAVSENLLVDGTRLIVTPGGRKGAMAALDKRTGRTVWASEPILHKGEADGPSYASPILFELGGRRQIVGCSAQHLFGADAESGRLLWKKPLPTTYTVLAITPVLCGDAVFTAAPYGPKGKLFRLRVKGEEVEAEEAWSSDIDTSHGGVLLVGDLLVGTGYQGFAGWMAVDAATGKVLHRSSDRDLTMGSAIWADGRYYCLNESGLMTLLEVDRQGLKIAGRFPLTEGRKRDAWAHPVLLDGRLYLRYHDRLTCYDVRAK